MKNKKEFYLTEQQAQNVLATLQEYLEINAKLKTEAKFRFDVLVYELKKKK